MSVIRPRSRAQGPRYRKILIRMWGDEKFRQLSKPQPNGQSLWIYLLTGPHTGIIPGLFEAGEAGLAEAIGWPIEAFRQALGEALDRGMAKVDWAARVVFLPNGILHNPPESPNVVRSWREAFNLIPECSLKNEALQRLKGYVEGMGKGFSQALGEALDAQEQEQEQEQYKGIRDRNNGDRARSNAGSLRDNFERFWEVYPRRRRIGRLKAFASWCRLKPPLAQVLVAIEKAKCSTDWTKDGGQFIPHPTTWLNGGRWMDESASEEVPRNPGIDLGPYVPR
jgi:hypothetical protein